MNGKTSQKGKHQVNEQVYLWRQMPTTKDNKGLIHFIRSPNTSDDRYVFEIIIADGVSIHIEYLKGSPSKSIKKLWQPQQQQTSKV